MSGDDRIDIDIRARVDGLRSGVAEAERHLETLQAAAARAAERSRDWTLASRAAVVGLGAVTAGAAAAAAAWGGYQVMQVSAALAIKDTADEIGKLGQRLGMETERVSEYRYAAALSDVTTTEFAQSVRNLSNRMQEAARGDNAAARTFEAMGISIRDANGHLKSADQVLGEIADRFASYRAGAEKTALANDVLGRSGERMIPMLNQGAAGLKEMADEARKLGVIYGDGLAKESERLNDNLTRLKLAAEGARVALGTDMVSGLADVTDWIIRAKKEGSALHAVLVGIGALEAKVLGMEINPLKVAEGNSNKAFSDLVEARKNLEQARAAANLADARMIPGLADFRNWRVDEAEQAVARAERRLAAFVRQRDSLLPKPEGAEKGRAPVPSSAWTDLFMNEAQRRRKALDELDRAYFEETRRFAGNQDKQLKLAAEYASKRQVLEEKFKSKRRAADDPIDVFDDRSFVTRDKDTAARIRESYDFENWAWREIAKDREKAATEAAKMAEAEERSAQALIAMTSQGKLNALAEQQDQAAKLLSEGRISFEGYDEILNQLGGIKDKGKDTFDELTRAVDGWGKDASRAFVDWAFTGKTSFSDLLGHMAREAAQMAAYEHMFKPAFAGLGDWIKGIFANADGGIYASSDLHRYANTIVSSPTLFRFANGGAFGNLGLMGEAGGEAIMPLSRDASGRLGVRAQGGGVEINIYNQAAGTQASATARQDTDGSTIIDVLVEQVEGRIAGNVSRGTGIAPVMEHRYGLNPAAGAWR